LKAVAKFPAFCGEGDDLKVTCTKELAAVFAHATDLTGSGGNDGGLHDIESAKCAGGQKGSECDFAPAANWETDKGMWTQPETAKQYYARGAFQLTGSANYGGLSAVLYEGYDSANILLEDPDKVATDGYLGFASALYKYLSAEPDRPSMHDVITGHWVPNQAEKDAGIKGGFGTSINILNRNPNCGGKSNKDVNTLIGYYKHFLTELGLDADFIENNLEDSMQCKDEGAFTQTTAGVYFARDWVTDKKCKLVTYMTAYSINDTEGYKKCVCYLFGGDDAEGACSSN